MSWELVIQAAIQFGWEVTQEIIKWSHAGPPTPEAIAAIRSVVNKTDAQYRAEAEARAKLAAQTTVTTPSPTPCG